MKNDVGTPTGTVGVDVGVAVVDSDLVIGEKSNLEKGASSPVDTAEDDRKSDEASTDIFLVETLSVVVVVVVVVGIIMESNIEPSARARGGGVSCWDVSVVASTMGFGAMALGANAGY